MLQRYREGLVPVPAVLDDQDREVLEAGRAVFATYLEKAAANDFHGALEDLWVYLRHLDGYIVKAEPWKLAKDEAAKDKLDAVLCQLYRALRATAVLLAPVMPAMAQTLWKCLGMTGSVEDQRFEGFAFDAPAPHAVLAPEPLFQRIDKEAVMKELEEQAAPAAPVAEELPLDVPPLKPVVEYDGFAMTDLRVGQVLTAEAVPKSKKLIKMTVDLGFETRTILGGIAAAYTPEELVGRKVVVVANLAPRALMGIESHGMLLAASDNNSKPYLIAPPDDARPGFIIK
jgi:methionyl-tRNA synthetase